MRIIFCMGLLGGCARKFRGVPLHLRLFILLYYTGGSVNSIPLPVPYRSSPASSALPCSMPTLFPYRRSPSPLSGNEQTSVPSLKASTESHSVSDRRSSQTTDYCSKKVLETQSYDYVSANYSTVSRTPQPGASQSCSPEKDARP